MIRDTYFFVFEIIGYDLRKYKTHGEFIIDEPITYKVIKAVENEFAKEIEAKDVITLNYIKL